MAVKTLQIARDVERVVSTQSNHVYVPDTNSFFLNHILPPETSWTDYAKKLIIIGDSKTLKKVLNTYVEYTRYFTSILRDHEFYITGGVSKELQREMRYLRRHYNYSLGSPRKIQKEREEFEVLDEDEYINIKPPKIEFNNKYLHRMLKDKMRDFLEILKEFRRFTWERENIIDDFYWNKQPYRKKLYDIVKREIDHYLSGFKNGQSDVDKELITTLFYFSIDSPDKDIVSLSNDHHILDGVKKVKQHLGNCRVRVIGVNPKTGRLEIKL